MQLTSKIVCFTVVSGQLIVSPWTARAATYSKANNNTTLNLPGSWSGGVVPTSADIGQWDSTVSTAANCTNNLGANTNWAGIKIIGPVAPVSITNSAATLTLGASGIDMSMAAKNLSISTPLALGAAQAWNVTNGLTLAVSGVLSGAGGDALTKSGAGTLTLSGANTYSGGTTIADGTITLVNSHEFGAGPVVVNSNGVAYNYSASSVTVTNAVTLNGGEFHTGGGNAGTKNIWAGPVTLAASSLVQSDGSTTGNSFTGGLNLGNSSYTLTVGGNGNNSGSANNFNCVISGGPNATMLVNSSGLAYLNAANTFSGSVRSGWSLVLQNVNALQNATLDMNSADSGSVTLINNAVIGALTGSRNLDLSVSSISIGNNDSSTTYSGALTNSGSLTKVGTGTLTLSGVNTYTGATTISAGTLMIGGAGQLGGGSYAAAITDNAAFSYGSSASQNLSGGISGTGTLTQNGPGTLSLTGAGSYGGATTVNGGTLQIINSFSAGTTYDIASGATTELTATTVNPLNSATTFNGAGTLKLDGGGNGAIIFGNNAVETVALSAGGLVWVTGTTAVTGSSSYNGRWDANLGSLQVDSGSTVNFVEGGNTASAQFDALNGGGTVSGGYGPGQYGGTTTISVGNANGSGTFSGTLNDNGGTGKLGFTKNGTGTETLSGANAYSGATTINAGTLALGAAGTLPAATTVNLAGGTLAMSTFNNTVNALQNNGSILAMGTWGAAGSGANHISAALTGTGILTVSTGGSSTSVVTSSANPSTYGAVTFTNTVTGSGGDGSAPSGAVTFYDGGVSIGTGTLVGSAGTVSQYTLTLNTLAVGTHSITASYAGNASYDVSTSGVLSQVVNPIPSTILWGTPTTIGSDWDVNASGTALYAYAGRSVTLNGVSFTAVNSGTTWGNVSLTGFGNYYATFGYAASPFSTLSTAYSNVLSGGAWGGATTGTVVLDGLSSGHAYSVQIWVNDSRSLAATRNETAGSLNFATLDYNNTGSAGGVGQFVIGTFVASGASQSFTLTSSSSVQLNAISVRDNGVYAFMPARADLAKYQPVITDSTNGSQTAAYLTDGLTFNGSYWQSGTNGTHWAEVDFPFPVAAGSVQLAMGGDNTSPPSAFSLQYLTNSTWVNVPGTTVSGNTNREANLVFAVPITASSFRFYDSSDSAVTIRELALYPPNGTNGFPFGSDVGIDLAHKQPAFDTAHTSGSYAVLAVDGRISPSSAWQTSLAGSNSLVVNLQFTNKIGSAHLYSGAGGVPPLANFVLQYWTGGAWANIPGGSVSGNSAGALVIPFTTPVTTTKVQLVFTNSGTSAVQELCVFSANDNGGYPLGTGVSTNPPLSAKYDTYSDSYYYLSNSAAGRTIVESNGTPALGLSGPSVLAGQYQVLLSFENGTYRLINHNTGLCLAGAQLTTNAGALLADEPYAALPDQEWYLQPVDGTNYYFVNQFSGLVVDTLGGSQAPGTPLVQNVMSNTPSQFWQVALASTFPKKGNGGPSLAVTYNVAWTYTWGSGTSVPLPTNVVYDPMNFGGGFFGSTLPNNILSLYPRWRIVGNSLNLLGYNEPDNVGQSNVDPTNGAIGWQSMNSMDLPLAGPAATSLSGTWLPIFFGYVTNWGLRVDYLPGHEYPGNNSSASSGIWINALQTAYNNWGIPMWMTEFGCVDWAGNQSWSEENNYNALAEFLWRAESLPWLRKYALFPFGGALAPNPWTATTPAPTSNSFDTNGVLTPLGELYGGWDDDANVESNKLYYIHNSGTSKRLSNTAASTSPNAQCIGVRDVSTQWTLVSAGGTNLYYVVSALDGRRLNYNGSSVSLVASGTTGTAVQWSLSPYQYGWYYLQHPASGLELSLAYNNSTFTATYTMVTNTTSSAAARWRLVVPYTPNPTVWTGNTNASWASAANWNSASVNPAVNFTGNYAVRFDSRSAANLGTVLNGNFCAYSITVSNPASPVTISGTNLLAIATGIDLSGASQNLTVSVPLYIGVAEGGAGTQFWTVAPARTLSVNGGLTGVAPLTIGGGGTVSLGGVDTCAGDTTVGGGATLQLSASEVLPNGAGAGNLVVYGTLDLNGNGDTINGLNGSGTVDNTGGPAATLVIGANNASNTNFTGVIQNTGGNLSLVKTGTGSLTLGGANTYAGSTTISAGTLALTGNGALADSAQIAVASGASLNLSGLTSAFILGAGQTLGNSGVGAVINGTNNCSAGTLSLVYDGLNPALIITNGGMRLSSSTTLAVNNTGTELAPGNYILISAATTNNKGLVAGTLPAVTVTGNRAVGAASLQIDGSGDLVLVIGSGTFQAWSGASDTSWTTAANWLTGVVPGAGGEVLFNSSATANLATVLNANFNLWLLTVTTPGGPVSIGGANTLAITNGIIMSAASQNLTITAPVVLGASQTWTVTNSRTLSVNGGVSDNGGGNALIVAGGGTVSLGGTNTYTGQTTVNAGTLSLAGPAIGTSITVASNAVLSETASGGIAGLGVTLTQNSTGVSTLSGTNTYGGATIISAGTLTIGGAGQLGGGNYAAAIVDNGALNYNSSAGQTLAGAISGSGILAVGGTGTLTLAATNTFTGNTAVNSGKLQVAGTGALGAGSYGGAIALNSGATLEYSSSANQIMSGAITGAGALTLDGTSASTLTLTGTNNTYSGLTTISGADRLSAGTASLSSKTAFTIVGNATSGGQLWLTSAAGTVSNSFSISGVGFTYSAGAIQCPNTAGFKISGPITLTGNARVGCLMGNAAFASATLSGQISGGGGLDFWGDYNGIAATNTYLLANPGPANNYTGNTTVDNNYYIVGSSGGDNTVLELGANEQIPSGPGMGILVLDGWNGNRLTTFELNGYSETVNGISNTTAGPYAIIQNTASGASTLTIGAANTNSTFSGKITDGGAGRTLALTKIGSGTLTLSGTNGYLGATTISAGTLALSGTSTLSSGNLIVAGGAMLNVSGKTAAFALASGATLTNSSVGAVINGTNNCGVGTLSLVYDGVNPCFLQTNGGMTLSASTVITVNNTGAQLAAGDYTIISAASTGNPGLVAGTLPAVAVTGGGAAGAVSLQINGTGGLDLVVSGTPRAAGLSRVLPPAEISSLVLTGGNLILQGGSGPALGTYSILTSTDLYAPRWSWTTNTTGAFTTDGAFSNAIPVSTQGQHFFQLKQP